MTMDILLIEDTPGDVRWLNQAALPMKVHG
jgi:hypothetical protein